MKKENFAIINNGVVTNLAGKNVTKQVKASVLAKAIEDCEKVMQINAQGDWSREKYMSADLIKEVLKAAKTVNKPVNTSTAVNPVMSFIQTSIDKKPVDLFISDLKWKYLCRSVIRGKNIMMTGPAGTGKTYTAQQVAKGLSNPFFYFNLGATQDPRSTLIGNTHFKEGEGTFFNASLFVKAIQTENAVILLDEMSRANPEAWNILMTVLDEGQRYLRLDEQEGAPTIKVAKGVCFIATANIGNQYTSTRVMDRALLDRFVIVEVEPLSTEAETSLLSMTYPDLRTEAVNAIAEIANMSRIELKTEDPKISSAISTRSTMELAGLMYDGFTLSESAEVAIYPFYENEGGIDSERTFIKQIVQKYSHIDIPTSEVTESESTDDLFNITNEDEK